MTPIALVVWALALAVSIVVVGLAAGIATLIIHTAANTKKDTKND